MPVILNLSNERQLPENEVEALRNVARSNQSDMLIVGVHNMMLHHISFMDSFSVEPVFDHHFNHSGTRRHRHLAERLERQLNHGNTFLQTFNLYMEQTRSVSSRMGTVRKSMLEKIDNYAFTVNPGDFSCDEEYLNCPVTLCIPAKGVFVRNALRSDVCSLYDRDALTEIIQRNAPHPLSREVFSPEMIVGKDECHFNTTEQHFCVAYSQDSYL
ncbi:T3SS effector NleG family protein [Escherichia coli]|uniref:T3SS effector NleG family protein n=1 Tax=Escherichia coli TaxID=562 RepID=UPI000BE14E88|nr:T3SS effector NleG family protein [Escherichia coli]EJH1737801.1 T3SS effector NleG family protein [Escherichia coli]CAD5742681.1 T3SS effector NleG [Escherichia coli]HBA9710841.1 DUF1076 domain-containing protein [Escherichia coli]